jgi:hypothetical protein
MGTITLQELVMGLALGAAAYFIIKKIFASDGPTLMSRVKDNIFSLSGLITTVIHVFMISGLVSCYILFQSQVMGVDPMAGTKAPAAQGKGK